MDPGPPDVTDFCPAGIATTLNRFTYNATHSTTFVDGNSQSYTIRPMIIGDRVRERMEAAGLSQSELARRVGLSQPTIFQLINRGKKGSTRLHVIARELETTPAYLSGETDDPKSDIPDSAPLSADTRKLIELFGRLTQSDRAALLQIAGSMVGGRGVEEPLR